MKNRFQKAATATVAILLTCTFSAAHAATRADVAKARAECASQKQRVTGMERKSGKNEQLNQAKVDWEAACQRAEVLINEMNGTAPPKVVTPAT